MWALLWEVFMVNTVWKSFYSVLGSFAAREVSNSIVQTQDNTMKTKFYFLFFSMTQDPTFLRSWQSGKHWITYRFFTIIPPWSLLTHTGVTVQKHCIGQSFIHCDAEEVNGYIYARKRFSGFYYYYYDSKKWHYSKQLGPLYFWFFFFSLTHDFKCIS